MPDTKAIRAQIRETPTRSDPQVAAELGVSRELVTQVRAEMGAKNTWKKEKSTDGNGGTQSRPHEGRSTRSAGGPLDGPGGRGRQLSQGGQEAAPDAGAHAGAGGRSSQGRREVRRATRRRDRKGEAEGLLKHQAGSPATKHIAGPPATKTLSSASIAPEAHR